ncbi:MAG: hypothetical protein JOZ87_28135 [Chloroflexi bacterium]|nr:hypothetical protein [Chloroflexota bacterium]
MVLGWMRRHGTLGLILVLPDGTRRLVPAAWTDLEPGVSAPPNGREAIGSLADLLNACRVLAGLARRLGPRPDDGRHPVEEGARAAAAGPAGDAGAFGVRVGRRSRPRPGRRHRSPGSPDRTGRRSQGT